MANLAGTWRGKFDGPTGNSGEVSFVLSQRANQLTGSAEIADVSSGPATYSIDGDVGPPIRFRLIPERIVAAAGVVTVTATLKGDHSISGHWESTINTRGNFRASRDQVDQTRLEENTSSAHDSARRLSPVKSTVVTPHLFMSCVLADKEWSDLLNQNLKRYGNLSIESAAFGDSDRLYDPAAHTIDRATIAVVFLSPAYVESVNAMRALEHIARPRSGESLTTFYLVVRPFDWKLVDGIVNIDTLASAQPLESQPSAAVSSEFESLAARIGGLMQPFGSTAGIADTVHDVAATTQQGYEFSLSADLVIKSAGTLAERSGRFGITSSCILFAFVETAADRSDSTSFMADRCRRAGNYGTALERFLSDADSDPRRASEYAGSVGRVSAGVLEILETARRIATDLSGMPTIHSKHLLAATLTVPKRSLGTIQRRLRQMGVEYADLIRDFQQFIREVSPPISHAKWDAIFGEHQVESKANDRQAVVPATERGFVSGPSGYSSETVGLGTAANVGDDLGVEVYADRLGDLVALRETKLPLAIGLFGIWGSGKSHFMNLIDRRLKQRCREAEDVNGNSPWCRRIVPIYFSAWHYLDTNLWASLVSQIFESLFAYLQPKKDQMERVQALLERASGATARAVEELELAKVETHRARNELDTAEKSRGEEQRAMSDFLSGLASLLPDLDLASLRETTSEVLGVQKEIRSLEELRQVCLDANETRGRLRRVWNAFCQPEGFSFRMGRLVMVVAVATTSSLIAIYLPVLRERLTPFGAVLAPWFAGLAWCLPWIRSVQRRADRDIDKLNSWLNEAEKAHAERKKSPVVEEKMARLDAAQAREDCAKIRLGEARARERQLEEEASNLEPGRRMGRFIEQRAQSTDYRGQLGLISLARRDFQELSELFSDTEAFKQRIAARNSQSADAAEELHEIDELSRAIDRIVLFVDDLDRCQSDKIVEILQAVHLLLAFPLFTVVVGVDQRCLKQSLEMQFQGLVKEDDRSKWEEGRVGQDHATTALDYLEKIFHVPFHLPRMEKEGFQALLKTLTTQNGKGDAEIGFAKEDSPDPGQIDATLPNESSATTVSDLDTQAEIGWESQESVGVEEKVRVEVAKSDEPVVGSVPLKAWERRALEDYFDLVRTPRAAKRLLNTFRLVRAGIPEQEWVAYCGDGSTSGEFRLPMMLLACAAGYPAEARTWFERLRETDVADSFTFPDGTTGPLAWQRFKASYEMSVAEQGTLATRTAMTKWVDRVDRFTF